MTPPLVLVAALADNDVIGDDNRLIWRLKSDLQRFKALTIGKPMIMGRKTFLSIGRPLPGRRTIVVSRDPAFAADGVVMARSLQDAIAKAQLAAEEMGVNEIIVAGGADIYGQLLPSCDRLHLTRVHAAPEGDARFPAFDASAFVETSRESHPADADNEHAFTFIDYSRRETVAAR
jgi:dihydrofolate reductase